MSGGSSGTPPPPGADKALVAAQTHAAAVVSAAPEGGFMPEVLDADKFIANVEAWEKIKAHIMSKLVEKKHYGRVKGVPKKFLWQPGANIITGGFNVKAAEPIIQVGWDESADHEGVPYRYFWARARVPLVSRYTGYQVWDGFWRGASTTERRFTERIERYGNQAEDFMEEVIRTAQKRAYVDSARMFAGFDGEFTQDEELVEQGGLAEYEPGSKQGGPRGGESMTSGDPATKPQLGYLDGLGYTADIIKKECEARGWPFLTKSGASQLIREGNRNARQARRRPPDLSKTDASFQ